MGYHIDWSCHRTQYYFADERYRFPPNDETLQSHIIKMWQPSQTYTGKRKKIVKKGIYKQN